MSDATQQNDFGGAAGRVSHPPFVLSRVRRSNARRLGLALLSIAAFGGCVQPAIHDPARTGPYYSPANHAGDPQLPANLRRVVLLPVAAGPAAAPESVAALDPVFIAELQKQNRFEVVTLTREECLRKFHVEEFQSTAALPHDFATRLRADYAADAVLFVDLTVFKPYRPLALGVRGKLATLEGEVRLLWTFDNVFAAGDPRVANSARHYFLGTDTGGAPADPTQSVLQSPSRFATYVAATMFATLPPVYTPPPPPPAESRSSAAIAH